MSFMQFVEAVKTVTYGFEEIVCIVKNFYNNFWLDFNISELMSGMMWHLRYIEAALPVVFLLLSCVVALAGKRMFGLLRFLAFFAVGGLIGVYTLSPLILGVMPTLPTWVIGIVAGVVAGVLSKILYFIVLVTVSGYSTYIICYRGMIPGVSAFTKENWIIGLVVAIVAIILVIVLLKYIEMLGTAMLGGFGIATVVRSWYDYTALEMFVGREWLAVLTFTLVIAILGLLVQFKTRKRYT
jgi:hypothetical protein